ncbi:unnamed protein product [Sphacelaria rigidula]
MPPMKPIVNCATAVLLFSFSCPQTTTSTAFVPSPNFTRTNLRNTRTSPPYSTVPPALSSSRNLASGARQRVAGRSRAAHGGENNANAKKAPVSVLDRPWDVEVLLHGERRVITVQPGDSVLEAAEMSGMNVSYDCRRGNCISCAARVQAGSSENYENRADRRADDGAPEGFVLSCSTYPVGPGVKLELSANAEMWTAFCTKFEDGTTRGLLRQASASVMRDYNERHPEEFRETIERQFKSQ